MQKFALVSLFILGIFVPVFASAQINLNLNYPIFGNIDLATDQNINFILAWLYYAFVGITSVAAFAMLIWGGMQWLASGAVPSQALEAREKLRGAVLGLLLVFGSFLIIQIINPELTILDQGIVEVQQGEVPRSGLKTGEVPNSLFPNTGTPSFPSGQTPTGLPQCSDGIDNDNDQTADYAGAAGLPADPECNGDPNGTSESGAAPLPPPAGGHLLSHTIHSLDGGTQDSMTNLLLDNPQYVHSGDTISLIAGNNTATLTSGAMDNVNAVAGKLRAKFGNSIEIVLATAGVSNIQFAAQNVSSDIDGLSFVYEPLYNDFPTADFNAKNAAAFLDKTAQVASQSLAATQPKNLKFTWRVTGRLITNDAQPVMGISYGRDFAQGTDGATVQTQRFVRDLNGQFKPVVDAIIQQYQAAGVLGQRTLITRITVGTDQHNGVTASEAIEAAKYVWGKAGVTMPALFPSYAAMSEVKQFYDLRESLP